MKHLIIIASFTLASLSANAFAGKCEEANLTQDQKEAIHDLMHSKKADMKALKQSIVRDYKLLKEALGSEEATADDAAELMSNIGTNRFILGGHIREMFVEVIFNIAEFEQRAPLMKCMKEHHKKKPGDGHGII